MKGIVVLGATGSIGRQALDVVERHRDRYRVVALTAHRDVEGMLALCRLHRPRYAVMADEGAARALAERMPPPIQVLSGAGGLEAVVAMPEVHTVVAGIVGAAGLRPTLGAARAGKRILLANKETLVMAGRLFMEEVERHGAELLPIDSEHNALFQCLPGGFAGDLDKAGVRRLWLTASGGPFRDYPLESLSRVTPEQACRHPNWEMGPKISVDSATMMNKGLEVIEACWLFHASPERIKVVIHPQSLVHALVEYIDGSFLAHAGTSDMRIPIAHALAWPERIPSGASPLDLYHMGAWEFHPPDMSRYPCLRLALEAMEAGGTAPAILNAANEVAVEAFLRRRIAFTQIPQVIETVLLRMEAAEASTLEAVLAADKEARRRAREAMASLEEKAALS
ncbi:MAG: 1-deoxy-D-xylulose-5-phosphate reductoisomerase [Gammaproteobacteria bacterium]|nr:MAG: 1-deoxy-D-xylulose-5-phosphate reductoisomerase [Gammaproteobacteria bacterium]